MLFIHEMLEKSAIDYPSKEAFIYKDKYFTFQEIDKASNMLANFLLEKGINHGDRIGIYSIKCIEEIIVIFAAVKLGCIFVHINPHFKEDQLDYIVLDCDIKVLFSHRVKERVLNKSNINYFNLIISFSDKLNLIEQDGIYFLSKILKRENLNKKININNQENDIAAIIYTSGSTGKPKGVIVTHRILYDSTVESAYILENNQDDCLISVTPFSFDGALSQLFTAIYAGGRLVLEDSLFPKDIVDTMLNKKITGFHAVPSFWRMLLRKHSPLANHKYPHLRYISIIGEVFGYDEVMRLKSILSSTKFYMMYGTTEAFRSTYLDPDEFEEKYPSVGHPLPGVDITIVDENGNQCRPGEIGEIVHSGKFISPGYWNNSEKSRETFIDGKLCTGDLGKIDKEGYLYFSGRKDEMIKSMGYRISPEEIEEYLYKIDGVTEAAVVSFLDKQYGNAIKVVIVRENGYNLSKQKIENYCKKYLPYYMVPKVIEFRKELPKTGTVKIDRSQLKQRGRF